MDISQIKKKLQENLKPSRYEHSIGVMETAVKMAKRFGADEEKAQLAGLLHDCAKYISEQQGYELCKEWKISLDEVSKENYAIVHQYLGRKIARDDYGIEDAEVLDAIECHATGKAGMSALEKIIYISDMIEPNRLKKPYDGLERLIELAGIDLDMALLFGLELSCRHIFNTKKQLHLDTVRARNFILSEFERKNT